MMEMNDKSDSLITTLITALNNNNYDTAKLLIAIAKQKEIDVVTRVLEAVYDIMTEILIARRTKYIVDWPHKYTVKDQHNAGYKPAKGIYSVFDVTSGTASLAGIIYTKKIPVHNSYPDRRTITNKEEFVRLESNILRTWFEKITGDKYDK